MNTGLNVSLVQVHTGGILVRILRGYRKTTAGFHRDLNKRKVYSGRLPAMYAV